MNRRFAPAFLAVAIACTLSIGASMQPPPSPSDQKVAEQAGVAAAGGSLNVSGQLPFGKNYQTSLVVVITYQYPDGDTVRVLFGPNEGEREPAAGWIMANGDFFVEKGCAYMYYSGAASPSGASTQPGNTRPYIRTNRVNAVGKGSAWAVQVGDNHDRIYFVEGTDVDCESEIVPTFDKTLNTVSKKSFTLLPNHSATTALNPFTAEASYLTDSGAKAFAAYVDTFYPLYGMPKMQ